MEVVPIDSITQQFEQITNFPPFPPDLFGPVTEHILKENIRLSADKARAVAAVGHYKMMVNKYQDKVKEKESSIRNLKRNLGTLEARWKALSRQLRHLDTVRKASNSEIQENVEDDARDTQDVIKLLNEQLHAQADESNKTFVELTSARFELDDTKNRLASAHDQVAVLEVELSEQVDALADAQIELSRTQGALKVAKRNCLAEEVSHRTLRALLEAKTAQYSDGLLQRDQLIVRLAKDHNFSAQKLDQLEVNTQAFLDGIEDEVRAIHHSSDTPGRTRPFPTPAPTPSPTMSRSSSSRGDESDPLTPEGSTPRQARNKFIHTLVLNQAKSNERKKRRACEMESELELRVNGKKRRMHAPLSGGVRLGVLRPSGNSSTSLEEAETSTSAAAAAAATAATTTTAKPVLTLRQRLGDIVPENPTRNRRSRKMRVAPTPISASSSC